MNTFLKTHYASNRDVLDLYQSLNIAMAESQHSDESSSTSAIYREVHVICMKYIVLIMFDHNSIKTGPFWKQV